MKTFTVGELKAHFSEVLRDVGNGEAVTVEYGRKHVPVAVIVPYEEYVSSASQRKLGILETRGSYSIRGDFEMSDEELLER
jgi:prevent-host-death family protein